MKIEAIRVYQVDLPLHENTYKWSGGKSVTVFDSNVVGLRVSRRERNNQNILLAQGFYRYDSDGVMFKPHCQLGS